jgi:hypothetical protein
MKPRQFLTIDWTIFVDMVLIGLALFFRFLPAPFTLLSFVTLSVYVLQGHGRIIIGLFFLWFFVMINPGVASLNSSVSIGKYLVVACCMASVVLRASFIKGQFLVSNGLLFLLILTLFVVIHSLGVSDHKLVSILKAGFWGSVMLVLVSAWSNLSRIEQEKVLKNIFLSLIVLSICSVPFLFHPLGFLANGSGFQGLLNQPQVFGVTMSLTAAFVFSQILSKRNNFGFWLLFLFLLLMIVLSEARIAGVALVFSILLSIFWWSISLTKSTSQEFKGVNSISSIIIFIFGVSFLVFYAQEVSQILLNYIEKGGRDGDINGLADAYMESRGFLVARMVANILENPWFGIGFGVDSAHPDQFEVIRDPVFGLPLSAPVEKGVLPLVVIEELGVLLGIIIFVWLFLIAEKSRKLGFHSLVLVFTIYLVNMGEAMMFSPGGMGLLVMIFISYVIAGKSSRNYWPSGTTVPWGCAQRPPNKGPLQLNNVAE